MSRFVPLSSAVIGLLVFLPGVVLFVSTSMHGLNSEDEVVASTAVGSIPLDHLVEPSTAIDVVIPKTAQWKRIRDRWGEPDFIVSAVSSERYFAYCLANLGIGIEVHQHGKPIPVEASYPGYGYSYDYSEDCGSWGSLRFRAALGTELRVAISRSGQRPLPSGELVVRGDWIYEKDKLVGDELDGDLQAFAAAASILGLSLVAIAVFFQRRRALGRRS